MSDLIKKIRNNIATLNGSELKEVANNESLRELFSQKQTLILSMNVAKRKAAENAAKPYLESIEEIDKMYAVLLMLISE